jgi:uncharacterized phiE125 gp8 family phage protein
MWQSPVTITPPAAEPITLEQAKQFVRVDGSDLDLEISSYIKGACAHVQTLTSTRLATQTVEVTADSFADLAVLPIGPVQSVSQIHYVNDAGAEQLLEATTYELSGAGLEQGIRPVSGTRWPGYGNRAVRVQLVVGYAPEAAALPSDITLALLLSVRALFDDKKPDVDCWLVNHRIYC